MVRNLVSAGVPERTAMQVTGPQDPFGLRRYDIMNEADLSAALGRLADATGTKRGQSRAPGKVTRFRPPLTISTFAREIGAGSGDRTRTPLSGPRILSLL